MAAPEREGRCSVALHAQVRSSRAALAFGPEADPDLPVGGRRIDLYDHRLGRDPLELKAELLVGREAREGAHDEEEERELELPQALVDPLQVQAPLPSRAKLWVVKRRRSGHYGTVKRLQSSLPLLALSALLAAPGAAQERSPQDRPAGPALETTWEVSLKGKPIGGEVTRTTRVPGGFLLETRGEYRVTEEPFVYRARLRFEGVASLASYALSSAKIRASALRTPQGIKHSVAYGAGADALGSESLARDKGAQRPIVLLDTLCFSHYELVGRLAVQREHAAFEFLALTPQSKAFPAARFEPGKAGKLLIGGVERAVRSALVKVGALEARLTYDQESGRVYRVSDSQGYLAQTTLYPRPYRERQVEIPQTPGALLGAGPIQGTYTLPGNAPGPFPTLLILPGSGPTDRDSTIGANAPLRDLARELAARGVASLRCDKAAFRLRRAFSSGDKEQVKAARARFGSVTFADEYERDALPCLEWLAARPETRQLVLCGHSLGAVAAAEIASVSSRVAGVILLAGPARSSEELLVEQTTYQLGEVREAPQAMVEAQVKQIRETFAGIRAGKFPPGRNIMGAPVGYWKDLDQRPLPPKVLARLSQPALVIQGGKDCQVRKADYDLLVKALEGREAPHEAHFFPELNHLFMTCVGPSTGLEYRVEGELDPRLPKAVAAWVSRTFPSK